MAAPSPPPRAPRLVKAAFLADRERLVEETRASRLLYFPGPIAWTVVFLLLAYLTWAPAAGLPSFSAFRSAVDQLASLAGADVGTTRLLITLVFLLVAAVGILWLMVRFVRWTRTVYAITDRRVLVQRGILGRDLDEIPVAQIRAVEVVQNARQRLLGYGTVTVSSQAGTKALGHGDWRGIPRPFRFQRLIEDARGSPPSTVPSSAAPPK